MACEVHGVHAGVPGPGAHAHDAAVGCLGAGGGPAGRHAVSQQTRSPQPRISEFRFLGDPLWTQEFLLIIKNLLESNPVKSRFLVRELTSHPIHAVRIHTVRNPRSRNPGNTLCTQEIQPCTKIRAGSGRTLELSESYFVNQTCQELPGAELLKPSHAAAQRAPMRGVRIGGGFSAAHPEQALTSEGRTSPRPRKSPSFSTRGYLTTWILTRLGAWDS